MARDLQPQAFHEPRATRLAFDVIRQLATRERGVSALAREKSSFAVQGHHGRFRRVRCICVAGLYGRSGQHRHRGFKPSG